jgi:hypothetical protein
VHNILSDSNHERAVIVHGRYDIVCPMRSAWALHKVWPQADLRVVGDAGHASFEPGIALELVRATDAFAARSKYLKHNGSTDRPASRAKLETPEKIP